MAIYNEILAPRFARALQKITSIKGGVPAKQLSGEIMPVLPLFWGAENRYLEGWQRYGFSQSVAAAASFLSLAQLRNPVGSNVVVVLEKLLVENTNASAIQYNLYMGNRTLDYANLFTASNFQRLDARGQPISSLIGSWSNALAAVGLPAVVIAQTIIAANVSWDFITTDVQEVTLLPGDAAQILPASFNLTSNFSFFWRERQLEESERT